MIDFYEDNYRSILELLPSYHRPGEALEVFRIIETCLNSSHPYILQLDLFEISEKNIDLIREAMEAAATCQPKSFDNLNIIVHQTSIQVSHQHLKKGYLTFIIILQNLWQFPEFVKPLMLFHHLETLTFKFRYILGVEGMYALSKDMQSSLANLDLEKSCPKLRNIRFWCKGKRGEQKLIHHRPQWHPVRD